MTTSDGNWSVVPYGSYTAFTPTLPEFYWNVYSAEQRIKHICNEIDKLVNYADNLGVHLNITHQDVEALKKLFQNFIEHGFEKYYEEQIEKWFQDHAWEIYQKIAKQVFFGLTSDGYFCAYVPDSWKEITFDTGAVYGRSDYGRLCLKFDAESAIDNTYSYSLNNWQATSSQLKQQLLELVADLETNSKRTDAVFDTVYTNLDTDISKAGDNI